MPSSQTKQPNALTLKQAANWQCRACGRLCRRHDEHIDDFALRVGCDVDDVKAHPRRWMLHVTKLHKDTVVIEIGNTSKGNTSKGSTSKRLKNTSRVVLCGSCHRAYHNYRRWQCRQRQQRQQQEHTGQLTLSDIRLPLTGLQLSLTEGVTPYEIVNPQPPHKRTK